MTNTNQTKTEATNEQIERLWASAMNLNTKAIKKLAAIAANKE